MTDADLDAAYTVLCRKITELGEANATLFLARLAMLAIARLNDAGAAKDLIEAAAAGRPTIALAAGGALETIIAGETGAFFREATAASLAQALRDFDSARYLPARLRAHAESFAPPRFVERLRAIVDGAIEGRQKAFSRPLR